MGDYFDMVGFRYFGSHDKHMLYCLKYCFVHQILRLGALQVMLVYFSCVSFVIHQAKFGSSFR